MRFRLMLTLGLAIALAAGAQPLGLQDLARVNSLGAAIQFSLDGRFTAYEIQDRTSTTGSYFHFCRTGTPPVGIGHSVWIATSVCGG